MSDPPIRPPSNDQRSSNINSAQRAEDALVCPNTAVGERVDEEGARVQMRAVWRNSAGSITHRGQRRQVEYIDHPIGGRGKEVEQSIGGRGKRVDRRPLEREEECRIIAAVPSFQ